MPISLILLFLLIITLSALLFFIWKRKSKSSLQIKTKEEFKEISKIDQSSFEKSLTSQETLKKENLKSLTQIQQPLSELGSPSLQPHLLSQEATTPSEPPKSLEKALEKTRVGFWGKVKDLFSKQTLLTSTELEELEEILYISDLGPETVQKLMKSIEQKLTKSEKADYSLVKNAIKDEMNEIFKITNSTTSEATIQIHSSPSTFSWPHDLDKLHHHHQPTVWLIVGVNGAGKTTTIGKLAKKLASADKKVLVAAGDTFRAAAGEQLKVWTERAQVEIFAPEGVKDPSAVAFDACQKAKAKQFDVVIIDTAGRLHTQTNLMEELKKMKRVIEKVIVDSPHEIILVLDANAGQNALLQAKEFHSALGVTAVVLTKMDSTAKGGVAVGVACELKIPIKLIGIGEKIEDLRPFSSQEFVDAILK